MSTRASERTEGAQLTDYVGLLRRRWWIIVAATLIGLAASVGYTVHAHKEYTATAGVEVNPTAVNNAEQQAGAAKTAVNMDNESQLVQSATVAALAAKILHSSLTPAQLDTHISVIIPPNSQLLEISCSDSPSSAAAACANAVAAAYLQNRAATATSQINSEIAQLNREAQGLLNDIAGLKIKMNSLPPNSPTAAGDSALSADDTAKLHTLASEQATLETELGSSGSSYVATKATPPTKPSSPEKKLVLPSGTMVGLLIGLLIAIGVDRRDKLLRSDKYLDELDLPILLNMPGLNLRPQLALASPRSKVGRSYNELAQMVTTVLGDGRHILLVAGTASGPGAGVLAANLAAVITRTYADTTLVCADPAAVEPTLFGLRDGSGLAEVIAGSATVDEVARQVADIPELEVVGPGLDRTVALYDIRHEAAERLAGGLRARSGYVVMEAQASGDSPDAYTLGPLVDSALLVVEMQRTRKSDLADCMKRLEMLRVPVLGAVVLPRLQGRPAARTQASEPRVPSRPHPGMRSQPTAPGLDDSESGADGGKLAGRRPTAALSRPGDPGVQEKQDRHNPISKGNGSGSGSDDVAGEPADQVRGM
ncbi:MAG: Wzz/FepE/Etk N-terminal domain-containing protein [Streptosporangiaceae bacterium]